jgi:hypothetical protein
MTVDDAGNYTLQHMYDHVRFDPCDGKSTVIKKKLVV